MVPLRQLFGALAAAALTSSAAAQSVDYAALEQLVGEPVTTSVTGSPQRVSTLPNIERRVLGTLMGRF